MSIPAISGMSPVFQARTIDAFPSNKVSGSLEDIAMKAASDLSAHVQQTDTEAERVMSQIDFGNPIATMKAVHIVDQATVTSNFISSVVSKIPKGLEILNK